MGHAAFTRQWLLEDKMKTTNRTIFLLGAIIAVHVLIESDAGAQAVRASVETVRPASITLDVTRSGKSERLSANGLLNGGGFRIEYSQTSMGQDKFAIAEPAYKSWMPVELTLQLLGAGEYIFAVDRFTSALAVSGISISVPKIESAVSAKGVRLYRPGRPSFGNVTFTIGTGDYAFAKAWVQTASEGKEARKDITITVRVGERKARTIILRAAIPVQLTSIDSRTQTIEVKPGTIEILGDPPSPLLGWLTSTLVGQEWNATVRCQTDTRNFTYQDSFVMGYAIGKIERDEIRETWSFQPGSVTGLL